jgi:hypothetical protein
LFERTGLERDRSGGDAVRYAFSLFTAIASGGEPRIIWISPRAIGFEMDLQVGDYVRTETGLRGRILHISKQSAFVEVEVQLQGGVEILPFLLSELIKADPSVGGRGEPPGAVPPGDLPPGEPPAGPPTLGDQS